MPDVRKSPADPRWSKELDALFDPYDLADAPGGAVAIALHGDVIYSRAFGLANVELRVPNTLRTRFRIASVTKQFTCVAALLLAEDGKLDIDASIRRYIPELGCQSGEPTLRQLMNHSGGYRCCADLAFIANGAAIQPAGNPLQLQLRQTRGNFRPGESAIYCNGGYNLLSLAIERVANRPFGQVLLERILQPLRLLDTQLVPSDFEVHERLANLYVRRDERWRRWIYWSEGLSGDGGLIASLSDMLRWAQHLRGPRTIGADNSWQQMLSPTVLPNGQVYGYSLGLELDTYRGTRVIRHSGGVLGGTSHLLTIPEHELDLFVVTNGSAAVVTDLGRQIMDTVLGASLLAEAPPAQLEPYRPMLGQYYCSRTGMLLGLLEHKGSIALSLVGGPPIPLLESTGGLAAPFLKSNAGDWLVHRAQDGATSQELTVSDCGHPDTYRRIDTTTVAEWPMSEVGGRFFSPELQARAQFQLISGQPRLQIHGPLGYSDWDIRPLTRDLSIAVSRMFPIWTAAITLRRGADRVIGFELSSKRTRELAFRRSDASSEQSI